MPNVGAPADRTCSTCGSDQVKVALVTGRVTYYRCLVCQHGWSETDRRQPLTVQAWSPERRKVS
jgi:hypothetical protein